MLTHGDKCAILQALPELKGIKEQFAILHNRKNVTEDYKRLLNTLYCQVFAVICQFETKLSENARNEAQQLSLNDMFPTVSEYAKGVRPVMNYRDGMTLLMNTW